MRKLNMQLIPSTLFIFFLHQLPFISATSNHRDCPTKCGNLTVEYPFGIGLGAGCSLSPWYDINCDTSSNPPKPFLGRTNGVIIDISNTTLRTRSNGIASRCYNPTGSVARETHAFYAVKDDSPYTFSNENKFVLVGCDDVSYMEKLYTRNLISSCTAICSKKGDLIDGDCSGIGCCETSIPKGVKNFISFLNSYGNHSKVLSFNRCGYTFLGEKGSYQFRSSDVLDDYQSFEERIVETVPMVLDWVIGNQTCDEARKSDQFSCKENSVCVDFDAPFRGYHCKCIDGYKGNPYLSPGCQGH